LWFVNIWPTGQSQPTSSAINDAPGFNLANAVLVRAGTNGSIDVFVSDTANILIDINGYFIAAQSASTNGASTAVGTGASNSGSQNTAVGYNSLQSNNGSTNTAIGAYSLAGNSSGNNNTAVGASALLSNALGSANTALGTQTLLSNLVGNSNTAVGFSALDSSSTGSGNVGVGATSLWTTTSGSYNVALGTGALFGDTTGSWNIAVGYNAGNSITSGNANIDIGHTGSATDSGVIRIGTSGNQSSTYIAGIVTSTISGAPVVVNGNGQLGVQTSSARFKEDIQDIGNDSDALLRLRPVKFHYRMDESGNPLPLQYGLIAEEVDKVYPELVVHDESGEPFALSYQELPALLLNELQKQRRTIDEQKERIAAQDTKLQVLSERLSRLEKRPPADPKR
jgi:hypothetical protein